MNEEDANKRQTVSHDTPGTWNPAPSPRNLAPGTPISSDLHEPVACERCGAAMFRVHAVWRCPACGFKTDCCGW